ncbi:Biopterin-dependent aromatic amino acid hydroxylase [Paragonimus heterotremus]|uniref:phenylalanine 4-monooxygenase n=1 Tax=Paragonimus heterotremus TaxID=100268 RepID=A0A8J4SSY7_9TREM|nr:Biopterin-dependent aromatic amino acid hydroxylase [Paragonimus heterotremus]
MHCGTCGDSRLPNDTGVHAHIPRMGVPEEGDNDNSSIIFSVEESVGSLSNTLNIFKQSGVNLLHIESRPSKRGSGFYDFFVVCQNDSGDLTKVIDELKQMGSEPIWLTNKNSGCIFGSKFNVVLVMFMLLVAHEAPWFPKTIKELDHFANRVLTYGAELHSDHPGFTDVEYRSRRKMFADIAYNYKYGQPIPRVDYTQEETETWGVVYDHLMELFPTHACLEFNHVFPLLVQNCGYQRNKIPQLQDVSEYLKSCTGFTLRPVAGLLSSRDFLAGLAFRVFHSTQYLRHPSQPLYTPEPDVCHELIGHVPLLADAEFAQFAQEIGLASLGVCDSDIEKLATASERPFFHIICFWFTVEFGLCRQENGIRAYGAGLLSSYGELQYCLSDQATKVPFEPSKAAVQPYPITQYQPVYFISESFQSAKNKLRAFSQTLRRPFSVRYDPYTQSVDVIDSLETVKKVMKTIQSEVAVVQEAVNKMTPLKTRV